MALKENTLADYGERLTRVLQHIRANINRPTLAIAAAPPPRCFLT